MSKPNVRRVDGKDLPGQKYLLLLEKQDEYKQLLTTDPIPGVLYHYCKGCDTVKPVTRFSKNSRMRLGLLNQCLPCSVLRRAVNTPCEYLETKICKSCKLDKICTEFYQSKSNSDGYTGDCIKCFRLKELQRRQKRSGTVTSEIREYRRRRSIDTAAEFNLTLEEGVDIKFCPNCLRVRPTSDFYSSSGSPDGLTGYCTDCHHSKYKM